MSVLVLRDAEKKEFAKPITEKKLVFGGIFDQILEGFETDGAD